MKKLLLFLAALLTAMTAWASTFTVTNNGNTFTITRSSSSGAENVYYRTVSLSAMAGVHFTEAVGILNFLEGESEKTVTVTETPIGSIAEQYLFQMETMRTYRFEVLDYSGSQLAYKDREITYGSDYQHSADYVNQRITDLVYFDYNGNIKSDNDNRYLDVAYSSSDWIKVTDAGYPQGVHTISTDNLYNGSSALRTYLNNQGNRMYATVYFNQKEEADGYQYIQILADNSTTYDGNDQWGEVSDPSISLYKACFEMSYTGDLLAATPITVGMESDSLVMLDFDGYLDDDRIKVLYTLTDPELAGGTVVVENEKYFSNSFNYDLMFDQRAAVDGVYIPLVLMVNNTGTSAIRGVTAHLNNQTIEVEDAFIPPFQTKYFILSYVMDDDFTGYISSRVDVEYENVFKSTFNSRRKVSNLRSTMTKVTTVNNVDTEMKVLSQY